ncbi:MAG: hypothetical protein AAF211_33160 [Myxococcota bacterium]
MIDLLAEPSGGLVTGFVLIAFVTAVAVCAGVAVTSGRSAGLRAAGFAFAWMATTAALAASGWLDHWSPPRIVVVFGGVVAMLGWAARAEWARRLGTLPLAVLVGAQSFRIVVEILIHEAVIEGVANPAMTWTGSNFDIVPGVTALLLAPFASRLPRGVLQAWNLGSASVLVVTVTTAVLAAPTPIATVTSTPPNVWIASFPFVWLPAVLVLAAFLGHVVLYRRLAAEAP